MNPPLNTPPPAAPRRTLAVWLPDWPIQRLRRARPELARAAVALVTGDGRSERVAACSGEARRLGVGVGMRAPDAQSLVGPGRLRLAPHRPSDDRRALEALAAECEQFSPSVALVDSLDAANPSPDGLALDVTGLAPLWGDAPGPGEGRLAAAVVEWLARERLAGRVAVGSTLGLALGAARYAEWLGWSPAGGPLRLPEDGRLPAGRSVAARLPVEALRLGEAGAGAVGGVRDGVPALRDAIPALRDLGIDTVGGLLALPRGSLPARFGRELLERLDALLGTAPEPVESFRGEPPLAAAWPFETPVSSGEALEQALAALLARLETAMLRRRRGALRVLVRYDYDTPAGAGETLALRLFRPTPSARELAELAALHAAGMRMRGAVRAVRVLVGATAPLTSRQRTLFDDDPRDDPHALALLINRLASRVGAGRVSRVEKRRSHDPRRGYAPLPATDTPAAAFPLVAGEAARLRRLPLALAADGGAPVAVESQEDGSPGAVQGRAVARCWGPERIETGWWRGRSVCRDAYWVELVDGARLWLVRDLHGRCWRREGEFA